MCAGMSAKRRSRQASSLRCRCPPDGACQVLNEFQHLTLLHCTQQTLTAKQLPKEFGTSSLTHLTARSVQAIAACSCGMLLFQRNLDALDARYRHHFDSRPTGGIQGE